MHAGHKAQCPRGNVFKTFTPLNGRGEHLLPDTPWTRTWKSLLSNVGETLAGLERVLLARHPLKSEQVVAAVAEKPRPQLVEKEGVNRALPQCASLFLPEFPVQPPVGQRQLKIVGLVAKGSFGTVLKVLDCTQEKVFAMKVVPKVEVFRRDTLKQCKEEVSIQKQVRHPFVHGLGDTWQGQRHLFIMCPYCSSGDLYTLWKSVGRFAEAVIRLFATELVLVLAYLHNLGIIHRDVKMENILLDEQGHLKLTDFGLSRHLPWGERAYTICGTLHYMAPEVLSGGPYAHAADWWSMGVLLFALSTGKFPLAPEKDHVTMLESVRSCSYAIPSTLSQGLRLLLSELLCQDPQRRLRYLHHFRGHVFFRGMAFDAEILRKQPVEFVLGLLRAQETPIDSAAFSDFDLDLTLLATELCKFETRVQQGAIMGFYVGQWSCKCMVAGRQNDTGLFYPAGRWRGRRWLGVPGRFHLVKKPPRLRRRRHAANERAPAVPFKKIKSEARAVRARAEPLGYYYYYYYARPGPASPTMEAKDLDLLTPGTPGPTGLFPVSVAAAETPASPRCLPEAALDLPKEGVSPPLGKKGDPGTRALVADGEVPNSLPLFPAAGGSSPTREGSLVLETEVATGTPRSVASGETLQPSPLGFSEAGGGPSVEPAAPVLGQSERAGAGAAASSVSPGTWPSPPALPEGYMTGSPERKDLPLEQKGWSSPLFALAPAGSWGSPQEVGETPSAKGKDPTLQQKEDVGTPVSTLLARTPSPLPEANVNAPLEQDPSLSPGDQEGPVSPTSVGSAKISESPRSLLEAGEEKSWPPGESAASHVAGASPHPSVASPRTSWELKPSLLPQEKCTSTPLSVAPPWTSLPECPEADEKDFQKEGVPISRHGEGSGCHCHGCHGFWTSPLSLLEAGPSGSPEQRPAVFPGQKGVASSPVATEAWTSPPIVSVAGPNPGSIRRQEAGVNVSLIPVASASTWMSPLAHLEAGMNTSVEEKAVTKDNSAETDSLLWRCSREQLSGLSRMELEGRLESTLIILEALARQMRAGQEHQGMTAPVGPASQREASTQTPELDPKQEEQLYRDLYAGLRRRFLAGQRSRQSEQNLARLLVGALDEMRALSVGYHQCIEEGHSRAGAMQSQWAQIRLDYETFRNLLGRCSITMRRMAEEARAAREEMGQHQEVCQKLEERTTEVVAALARVKELVEAKAGLEKDLAAALQRVTGAEGERQQLRRETEGLSQQLAGQQDTIRRLEEEVARLSQEKERAEKERDGAQRDAREMSDCREFMDQENQIARRQLAETEEELRATLASLRERTMGLEDLKDAHRALQEEQEALRKDLASAEAEIQSVKGHLEGFARPLQQLWAVHAEFLDIADSLWAALPDEAVDMAPRSSCYTPARHTPHRLGASFVDSVLKAVAEKGSDTPGIWSATTAFAKATPVGLPTPSVAEIREDLATCVRDLQEAAGRIRLLSSQRQEAAREEVRALQDQITQLRQRSEDLEGQIQAEREAGATSLAKLNKALHVRMQNEKELQKALRQQEERLMVLSDHSREVTILQEEVSQLKYALQKAKTETSVLWEELQGVKESDTDWVKEKIWLRQEVGKLKDLLLQKDDQRAELLTSYLCQVRNLEGQLYEAKQALKKREKSQAEAKQVLSTIPAEVAGLPEVQRLSELLS
ncbi:hypothetical protein JRQ81_008369 [Phrynocephalus forsythii]|uniref:Protein kinase domain-containing protein n=1 Tax=Phrynocephalus forsythii TaxID=171643 RepID=A0A9Q0XBR2_9SAUR|nr:hypothetical protein JRQ81_008369 [Phrynocephalus forsythii]